MPSIAVSDEVLRRIRSLRDSDAESENGVLALAEFDREARQRAYESAGEDTQSTN